MRISIFLFTALFTAFLFGCGESNDPNEKLRKEKFEEVIAVHDEVMPIWGNMPTLRKELGKYQTVLKGQVENLSQEEREATADKILAIEKIREDLEEGHSGMRDWMKSVGEFNSKPKDMSHEDYLKRLEVEKAKIGEIQNLMESSTAAAKQMIASFEQ